MVEGEAAQPPRQASKRQALFSVQVAGQSAGPDAAIPPPTRIVAKTVLSCQAAKSFEEDVMGSASGRKVPESHASPKPIFAEEMN